MGNVDSLPADQGFLVVTVHEGSPAMDAGLQVDDDFILKVNEHYLRDMTKDEMLNMVEDHENNEMNILVYSRSQREIRQISMTPNRNWPGKVLLGLVVKTRPFEQSSQKKRRSTAFVDFGKAYEGVQETDKDTAEHEAKLKAALAASNSSKHSSFRLFRKDRERSSSSIDIGITRLRSLSSNSGDFAENSPLCLPVPPAGGITPVGDKDLQLEEISDKDYPPDIPMAVTPTHKDVVASPTIWEE